MHAQVFFRSVADSTVLVDMVVLDDPGETLREIGAAGQPVTVALCLDAGGIDDITHADHRFEEWADAMTVVDISLVQAADVTYLHLEGQGDDLTLELASGFRWSRDGE